MHRLSVGVRLWLVRAIDTCAARLCTVHVWLATLRDQLVPTPTLDPADIDRLAATILARMPPRPVYRASAVDREAAQVAHRHGCSVFLLASPGTRPVYVAQDTVDERLPPS